MRGAHIQETTSLMADYRSTKKEKEPTTRNEDGNDMMGKTQASRKDIMIV